MLISIPDESTKQLAALKNRRNAAARNYFRHADPGGLTPAEKQAWQIENLALAMLVQAAELRLRDEREMQRLLRNARKGDGFDFSHS